MIFGMHVWRGIDRKTFRRAEEKKFASSLCKSKSSPTQFGMDLETIMQPLCPFSSVPPSTCWPLGCWNRFPPPQPGLLPGPEGRNREKLQKLRFQKNIGKISDNSLSKRVVAAEKATTNRGGGGTATPPSGATIGIRTAAAHWGPSPGWP